MIIKNRDLTFNDDGAINLKMITNCISEHLKEVPRLQKLKDYYDGKHAILNRRKSSDYVANNKAVFNYAKSIVDGIIGYAFGQPIVYNNIDPLLLEHLVLIDEDSHNIELATDQSIFGRGYELIYMDDELTDKPMPYMAVLSPLNTFVVYDNSIRKSPMFAVTYSPNEDIDGNVINYTVLVYTDTNILTFIARDIEDTKPQLIAEEEHLFGAVPILELSNNKLQQGDYEQVIGLIDLYNILMNDRVSSKEQLVDSLLLI